MKRVDAKDKRRRDRGFFHDYDVETFHTDGHPRKWTDLREPPARLGPAAREERLDAVATVGHALFGRVKQRMNGNLAALAPWTPEFIDRCLLIEDLHLALFRRHYGSKKGALDVKAIGRAYVRFANLELKQADAVRDDGTIADYANGVPNSLYFACIAECFDVLAEHGRECDLWVALRPYAVAGILVMARTMFTCHHTLDSYDTSVLGESLPKARWKAIVKAYRALPIEELRMRWMRALQLAAPRSFHSAATEPSCGEQLQRIEDALATP